MEPDDLLCSRNARSRTPLVGRAQWKINQPPSLRDNKRAWMEHLFRSPFVMRIDQATIFKNEELGSCAQWETHPGHPEDDINKQTRKTVLVARCGLAGRPF